MIWTLSGSPVVSAPLFRTDGGLPFGAQFVSARFRDYDLLDLLAWLEERELVRPVEPVEPVEPTAHRAPQNL